MPSFSEIAEVGIVVTVIVIFAGAFIALCVICAQVDSVEEEMEEDEEGDDVPARHIKQIKLLSRTELLRRPQHFILWNIQSGEIEIDGIVTLVEAEDTEEVSFDYVSLDGLTSLRLNDCDWFDETTYLVLDGPYYNAHPEELSALPGASADT